VPDAALLRAVNVAGHRTVPMADLRDVAPDLGCGDGGDEGSERAGRHT